MLVSIHIREHIHLFALQKKKGIKVPLHGGQKHIGTQRRKVKIPPLWDWLITSKGGPTFFLKKSLCVDSLGNYFSTSLKLLETSGCHTFPLEDCHLEERSLCLLALTMDPLPWCFPRVLFFLDMGWPCDQRCFRPMRCAFILHHSGKK